MRTKRLDPPSTTARAAFLASQRCTQHWLVASAADCGLLAQGVVSAQIRVQAADAVAPDKLESAEEHAARIESTCTSTEVVEMVGTIRTTEGAKEP